MQREHNNPNVRSQDSKLTTILMRLKRIKQWLLEDGWDVRHPEAIATLLLKINQAIRRLEVDGYSMGT
jgi:hypothetical protein